MPVTPLHALPAGTVYLLLYRHIHGIALFLATFLIDVEPALYLFFDFPRPQFPLLFGGYTISGTHTITHNPFAVVFLVGPTMTALAKLLEFGKPLWLKFFGEAEWIDYSWKRTYLSASLGGFLHLGWDVTVGMWDINLGFPFIHIPNTFRSNEALHLILILSLALVLPAYLIGKRIGEGSPLKKLP